MSAEKFFEENKPTPSIYNTQMREHGYGEHQVIAFAEAYAKTNQTREYIDIKIASLQDQLSSPECNDPKRVECKLEAFEEMRAWVNL